MAQKKVIEPEVKKVKVPNISEFKNVTKKNIFTTVGRCGGGNTITLPTSEGDATEGLELV